MFYFCFQENTYTFFSKCLYNINSNEKLLGNFWFDHQKNLRIYVSYEMNKINMTINRFCSKKCHMKKNKKYIIVLFLVSLWNICSSVILVEANVSRSQRSTRNIFFEFISNFYLNDCFNARRTHDKSKQQTIYHNPWDTPH